MSASAGKLKDFPTGLSLMVPPSSAYANDYLNMQQTTYGSYGVAPGLPQTPKDTTEGKFIPIRYNTVTREIIFDTPEPKCPFKVGDWVIIRTSEDPFKAMHCRVGETFLYPTVTVAKHIERVMPLNPTPPAAIPSKKVSTPAAPSPQRSEFKPASLYVYDQNFDSLSEQQKREAIYALLDLFPSVSDMRQYLLRKKQSTLRSWIDRFSPAALGVLRWIIASNRACIMQVDDDQERLWGMPGFTQFRFAMGAPDKERRFVQAVRDTSSRLNLKYPTLFAWHGSPLQNWHSIIREGTYVCCSYDSDLIYRDTIVQSGKLTISRSTFQ